MTKHPHHEKPHSQPQGGEQSGSDGDTMNPKEPSQAQLDAEMKKNKEINKGKPGTDNSDSEGRTSGSGAGAGDGSGS